MARVLIVDDEPAVREVLITFLEDHGYEPSSAENGQKALEMLPDVRPHIVLLDVAMPGINGLKALDLIRQAAPGCVVIMMSGHASHHTALKALDQGAHDFIQKPFDFDYLGKMLLARVVTLEAES